MVSQVVLLALGFVLTSRPSPVFADGCVVSPQMSQGQKMPCLRESHVMFDQPTLTLEQLTKGPDFDPADPVKSRFMYVTPNDTLTCYFRPHFAFIRDKGQSLKFLCWQMAGPNAFFDRTGNKIDVDDVKVVISKDPGGESRAHLFAKSDSANANEIKADSFKVKYLSPPFPNHEKRLNEVFTEVAAARLLWALGFPADHMYSAGAVRCIGCGSDPFKDNLKDNKSSLKDGATTFRVVAIERLLPMDPIEASNDETWAWQDAHALYSSGWTREQQVGFDAYRLALGMLAYHNPLDSQNRLACAEWKPGADNPKVCAKPVILVQDIGSTFGKPGSFGNSRGDFGDWQGQRVFANAERCELKYPLKGSPTVLKEAQDQLVKRLGAFWRDGSTAGESSAEGRRIEHDGRGAQRVDRRVHGACGRNSRRQKLPAVTEAGRRFSVVPQDWSLTARRTAPVSARRLACALPLRERDRRRRRDGCSRRRCAHQDRRRG